jgi:peptide-methionine (S)-S-oxide reductase
MPRRIRLVTFPLLACAALAFAAASAVGATSSAKPAAKPAMAAAAAPAKPYVGVAYADFAGGCFWCMETQYESRPGILSVKSGYTGGKELHPTYEQVSNHQTGHFESVEVQFDPSKITYEQLLDLFWHSVDPTQGDGQFCDIGHQYQSAIFVRDESQRKAAEASQRAIEASGVLHGKKIVTEILPASTFWAAEEYHQDFWKKDPVRYHEYREGCGRDLRLAMLWGKNAVKPLVH